MFECLRVSDVNDPRLLARPGRKIGATIGHIVQRTCRRNNTTALPIRAHALLPADRVSILPTGEPLARLHRAFGTEGVCWSRRSYRVRRGQGPRRLTRTAWVRPGSAAERQSGEVVLEIRRPALGRCSVNELHIDRQTRSMWKQAPHHPNNRVRQRWQNASAKLLWGRLVPRLAV